VQKKERNDDDDDDDRDDDMDEITYLKTEQFFYNNECFAAIGLKSRFAEEPAALFSHKRAVFISLQREHSGLQRHVCLSTATCTYIYSYMII